MNFALGPLPPMSHVVRLLREANDAYDGGEFVTLIHVASHQQGGRWAQWAIYPHSPEAQEPDEQHGREWLPGDGTLFDAVGAARRLLADWRDEQ